MAKTNSSEPKVTRKRSQLPPVEFNELGRSARRVSSNVEPVYFGIAMERPTVAIFNAAVQDILSYKAVLSNQSRLVVVTDNPKFFKRVCASLGIDCIATSAVKAKMWKVYYETEAIAVKTPDSAETVYSKKVVNEKGSPQRLMPGDPRYPSLYNPADNHLLPPSRNPNINRIPPRSYTSPGTPGQPILPLW